MGEKEWIIVGLGKKKKNLKSFGGKKRKNLRFKKNPIGSG